MATGPFRTRLAQIFVTEEGTAGTYQTQSATEGFSAEIVESLIVHEGENYIPGTSKGNFQTQDEIPGLMSSSITARFELKGSGTPGTNPDYTDALKSCMMFADNGVSDVVLYPTSVQATSPAENPVDTAYSVTVLEDGLAYKLRGAWGNAVFTANTGEPIMCEITWTGGYVAMAADDLEDISTMSLDTTTGQPFLGASFATNFGASDTPVGVGAFTVDLGNQIGIRTDANDTDGVIGAFVQNRKITGSFEVEVEDPAVIGAEGAYLNLQRAGTSGTITTGTIGATSGNIVQLDIGRCVLRPITFGVRDGARIMTVPFGVSSQATDEEDATTPEFKITLT